MTSRTPAKRSAHGFSLVELALALGLLAFAITALLGVLPVGLDATGNSTQKSRADVMARDLLSTLRTRPDYKSLLPQFPLPDLTALDLTAPVVVTGILIRDNGLVAADAAEALFKADYSITADNDSNRVAYVTLTLRWPPQSDAPVNSHSLTTGVNLP